MWKDSSPRNYHAIINLAPMPRGRGRAVSVTCQCIFFVEWEIHVQVTPLDRPLPPGEGWGEGPPATSDSSISSQPLKSARERDRRSGLGGDVNVALFSEQRQLLAAAVDLAGGVNLRLAADLLFLGHQAAEIGVDPVRVRVGGEHGRVDLGSGTRGEIDDDVA